MNKHFKLTDTDLFQSPVKLAIFVAVFVTVILCTVILIQLDMKDGGINLAEVFHKKQPVIALSDNYQNQVSQILNDYLLIRNGQEFNQSEFCQNSVNQTVVKILDLKVPVDYKEFHLKLVVLLDKESKNCAEQDEMTKGELGEEWDELLDSYNWLTN